MEIKYVFEEKCVQKSSRCNGALWRMKAALPFSHSHALLHFSASVIYVSLIKRVFIRQTSTANDALNDFRSLTGCFSSRG